MSVWWWIPIGLVIWLALAIIIGIFTGTFIYHGHGPRDPWE